MTEKIVDDNVTPTERPVAQAFVRYLSSDAGRQTLGRYCLRLADLESDVFPELTRLFTVEYLGGWPRAYTELIETWQKVEPRLDLGPAPRLLDSGE